MRNFLAAFPDMELVGAVDSGEAAIAFCEREEPDVILMDLLMPGMGGIEATRQIKERHPDVQIIALTSSEDSELVRQALQAKAIGYLLKNISSFELAYAIRAAKSGRPVLSQEATDALVRMVNQPASGADDLTEREREVLTLVTRGLSNDQVADQLAISPATVKFHLRNLYVKFGVSGRAELIAFTYRQGLVT
jgi:NarL family two-component system response regulator LiaR